MCAPYLSLCVCDARAKLLIYIFNQSVCLSVYLSIYLSIYLSVYFSDSTFRKLWGEEEMAFFFSSLFLFYLFPFFN